MQVLNVRADLKNIVKYTGWNTCRDIVPKCLQKHANPTSVTIKSDKTVTIG